jgi:hypothetical protein
MAREPEAGNRQPGGADRLPTGVKVGRDGPRLALKAVDKSRFWRLDFLNFAVDEAALPSPHHSIPF